MKRIITQAAFGAISIVVSASSAFASDDMVALLRRMTLEEKVGQLVQMSSNDLTGPDKGQGGIDEKLDFIRKGQVGAVVNIASPDKVNRLQNVALRESRLGIPLLFGFDVVHGLHTTFPIPLAESCSWDLELMQATAAAAARESYNAGVRWVYAPMVDVSRDARWGRVAEGAGEDPYLGSLIAAARVKGFQTIEAGRVGKVLATVKHFAAYGAPEAGRDYAGVDISESTLRNVYLPPFRAAIEAGAASLMSAFHEISGVPCTANPHLLDEILRKEWGWKGFVVSDWGAVDELRTHGFASSVEAATQKAMRAGTDIDMCSGAYNASLAALVKNKRLDVASLDRAVLRVLEGKKAAGLFAQPLATQNNEDWPQHKPLAMRAALESIVLLKNEGNLLPLAKTTKRIAVIGPFAETKLEALGSWWALGRKEDVVTLAAGIRSLVAPGTEVRVALGTDFRGKTKNIEDAAALAKWSDIVVLSLGDPGWNTGENNSKVSLDLSLPQQELVRAVKATRKPVVVVLTNGGPLSITSEVDSFSAVVEAWALGQAAGTAIAQVLFGEHNPSGKLTITFPRHVGQVPIYHAHKNSGRPPTQPGGSHYTDSPSDPLFVFGHGLSYTTFAYENLRINPTEPKIGQTVTVEATVTNTGKRAGVEVAQLYVQDEVGSLTRPVRELKGFERVSLEPGASHRLRFTLTAQHLGYFDNAGRFLVEPGWFKAFVGTDSNASLTGRFELKQTR
ncbi:MAG: glycoside hydrolase family 3 N-terminal domain-containing protein [Deltaproteobacteria bacterium]|nr:glycoside hydrolase family 3 N-terminal domain-containing protein [Deltaproteobacteria bacterium]